jgi:hypothetical protein
VVTKGSYIGEDAVNVIAVGDFQVSDIRSGTVSQSDVIAPLCNLAVIRPDLMVYPWEIRVTVLSNATELNTGVKVSFDLG